MASLEDLEDLERSQDQDDQDKKDKKGGLGGGDNDVDADMKDVAEDENKDHEGIDPEILNSSTQDVVNRRRLLENDIRVMKQEHQRLVHEKTSMGKRIEENLEKIENNRYVFLTLSLLPGRGANGWGLSVGNFRIWSGMSLSYWTWTRRRMRRRMGQTSILMR